MPSWCLPRPHQSMTLMPHSALSPTRDRLNTKPRRTPYPLPSPLHWPLEMPPTNTLLSPTTEPLPRLILYAQTFHDSAGNYISLLPLITHHTGVTHVNIAAIHINEGPGNITLNDDAPNHEKFNTLWSEVRWLKGAGVKVLGMLGGAAKGSYERLSGTEEQVSIGYYFLLGLSIYEDHHLTPPVRILLPTTPRPPPHTPPRRHRPRHRRTNLPKHSNPSHIPATIRLRSGIPHHHGPRSHSPNPRSPNPLTTPSRPLTNPNAKPTPPPSPPSQRLQLSSARNKYLRPRNSLVQHAILLWLGRREFDAMV